MLNSINSDLIRGHIDTIILSVLREGDRYGYDILGEIEKKSGGQYTLKQPTLYSCLKRLENQGFIYKYWGTETNGGRRTYYSLTEMGKELFMKNKDEWEHSRGIIDMLISSSGAPVRPYILEPIDENTDNADPANSENISASERDTADDENAVNAETDESIAETASTETSEEPLASTDTENTEESTLTEETVSDDTAHGNDAIEFNSDNLSENIYADILAEEEKNRLVEDASTDLEESSDSIQNEQDADKLLGVSYAERVTSEDKSDESEYADSEDNISDDYFKDYDGEDETYEGEEIEIVDDSDEHTSHSEYSSPAESYTEDSREAYRVGDPLAADAETENVTAKTESESTETSENSTEYAFRSYEDADISEESRRDMIIQRGYRSVIRSLLNGEYRGHEVYLPHETTQASVTENHPAETYEAAATSVRTDPGQADFTGVIAAVRNMGDDVRIRTHNGNVDKEYNSAYQYYSNKLLLYKYGILFLLMAAEILIPYLIIKFAVGIEIRYEVLALVLSITGAAILPIYAVVANVVDPFKRKRYDFSMRNSLLFRLAIFVLMLVLIYALNVVLFMDIAFDAEYAFTLVMPALLATNLLVSPLLFQTLYDTKRFNVEG